MRQLFNIKGFTGDIITKEDLQYEEARKMWNRAIESYPLLIAYCKNKEDVKACILWAKENQVPIRIRSGGHHYAGFSTGDNLFVIDVSGLNEIILDEEKNEVTIGGGVRNRELYEYLGGKGYPFPGGGCPTVGVAGFTLGGGWGYSSRFLGLACDSLKEIELIDCKGNSIIANEENHTDLYWACRGSGGGQFGIVVSMTFDLPAKREVATLLRIEYLDVTKDEQVNMFQTWQNEIKGLCKEVNFKLSFYNSREKGRGILLLGILYGDTEAAHAILEPFKQIGHDMKLLVKTMPVLKVNRWIQDAHPDFEHYKSSGRFVTQDFSKEEMRELVSLVDTKAEGAYYTAVSCYGLGGEVGMKSQDETAFYYRHSQYILSFQSVWEDNQYSLENKNWFLERFKVIKDLTSGSFVNFPLDELEDYGKAYYGGHLDRLQKIKREYDPENLFSFKQSL